MSTTPFGLATDASDAVAEGAAARRSHGAGAAAGVAVVAALVGFALETPFLALGIPAAAIAGWWLGPKVRGSGGIVGIGLAMAATTVALADALVVSGSAISALVGAGRFDGPSLVETLAGLGFMWVIGFVVVGLPMLVVTVPCGLIWAAVVRRIAATGPQS